MAIQNEEKDKKSRLYLFLVIVALLLVNGALIFNLLKQGKEIETVEQQNEDLTAEKLELENALDGLNLELTEQKGANQRLDSIIGVKEQLLAEQKEQIRRALQNNQLSRAQISKLKEKIRDLNGLVARYEYEVDSLSKETDYLRDEVYARDKEIERHKREKDEIASDLSKANTQLDIAKRLEVQNITAVGVKMKSRSEKELSKLSRIDKVKVEFTLDNNPVADKESKTCYLQIVTPDKATLHDGQRGSGSFMYEGLQSLYTAKQNFTFSNSNENLLFYWDKSPAMTVGTYTVNVYCEGVKIGSTTFTLK